MSVAKRKTPIQMTNTARTTTRLHADSIITLMVDKNPKGKGSAAHARFEFYRSGMTIAEFLAAGGLKADVSWDHRHSFIALAQPGETAIGRVAEIAPPAPPTCEAVCEAVAETVQTEEPVAYTQADVDAAMSIAIEHMAEPKKLTTSEKIHKMMRADGGTTSAAIAEKFGWADASGAISTAIKNAPFAVKKERGAGGRVHYIAQ